MTNKENPCNKITDVQIKSLGYHYFVNYNNYFIALMPTISGEWQLNYCNDFEYISDFWRYKSFIQAATAMVQWDVNKTLEPAGWSFHPGTNRFNPLLEKT